MKLFEKHALLISNYIPRRPNEISLKEGMVQLTKEATQAQTFLRQHPAKLSSELYIRQWRVALFRKVSLRSLKDTSNA